MRMNIIERTINDVTVLDIEDNLALNENARLRRPGAGAIDVKPSTRNRRRFPASLRVLKELKKLLIDRYGSKNRLTR